MEKPKKIYDEFIIDFELSENSRKGLRGKIIEAFLKEKGGYWKNGLIHFNYIYLHVAPLS